MVAKPRYDAPSRSESPNPRWKEWLRETSANHRHPRRHPRGLRLFALSLFHLPRFLGPLRRRCARCPSLTHSLHPPAHRPDPETSRTCSSARYRTTPPAKSPAPPWRRRRRRAAPERPPPGLMVRFKVRLLLLLPVPAAAGLSPRGWERKGACREAMLTNPRLGRYPGATAETPSTQRSPGYSVRGIKRCSSVYVHVRVWVCVCVLFLVSCSLTFNVPAEACCECCRRAR